MPEEGHCCQDRIVVYVWMLMFCVCVSIWEGWLQRSVTSAVSQTVCRRHWHIPQDTHTPHLMSGCLCPGPYGERHHLHNVIFYLIRHSKCDQNLMKIFMWKSDWWYMIALWPKMRPLHPKPERLCFRFVLRSYLGREGGAYLTDKTSKCYKVKGDISRLFVKILRSPTSCEKWPFFRKGTRETNLRALLHVIPCGWCCAGGHVRTWGLF